ncbi:sulfatase-like hydrolase/transferase [Reichenbachiella versicolor]|uniref:sulfatase-like hydrolase/transferase n=1 Tax=Reichenbachiella versicolor TaxID=1821036 RepID=UPI000D6EA191|nr:sulfatase-like hydrolase/transferase [Reichenbachiella versicolor]
MIRIIATLFAFNIYGNLFAQVSPNIILIIADDQGWNGTSVQMDPDDTESKSDYYETPNLELLAAAGMRFSRAYSPSPKCSPSRMSILTAKSTARTGFTETNPEITTDEFLTTPASITSITQSETTLPEYLKSLTGLNYTTAHFGKWHLSGGGPSLHGFHESDGNTDNNDGDSGTSVNDDPKKIFTITQSGIDFMDDAILNNQPFYLQLSHYAVHTDIESTQSSLDKYNAKSTGTRHDNVSYAAMTEDLDESLGRILDYVDEKDIDDNTYIIYTSDNGGQTSQSSNEPLKLGKTMIFEGGIRVPFVVSGPGISANTHSTEPIIGYDLFPTIVDLIGSDLDGLPSNIDGISFKNILKGNASTLARENGLIFHSPHYATNPNKEPRSAIIKGENKLIVEYETGTRYLYDLSEDLSEATNLYSESSDQSAEIVIELRDYLMSVDAKLPSITSDKSDSDGDGIPDDWEIENLLGALYSDTDDTDSDGFSNLDEYQNDTDPLSVDEQTDDELELSINSTSSLPTLYPNPCRGVINIRNPQNESFQISLYSLDGRLVFHKSDTSSKVYLPSGIKGVYFYEIQFPKKSDTQRGKLSIL